MDQFLLIALNGLTLAAVYFLVASGLTLIFGLMRVVTMAHGTSYLLGGYLGYVIARETGNWLLGALGAALAVGILGLVIHQVLIRRFQDDDMRVALVTLGVALIGTDLMLAVFGGTATQVSDSGGIPGRAAAAGPGQLPADPPGDPAHRRAGGRRAHPLHQQDPLRIDRQGRRRRLAR